MLLRLTFFRSFAIVAMLLFSTGAIAQPDGKALFKANCASCHNKNMKSDMTGPALAGVQERWEDEADLYSWIRNSQALIKSGHPRANKLYNDWNQSVMNSFPNFTDEDIAAILTYIDFVASGGDKKEGGDDDDEVVVTKNDSNSLYLWLLLGVLAILAVVLARIISNLNYMAKVKAGEDPGERKTLFELVTSPALLSFLTFAFVVVAGYTALDNGTGLGRQQAYAPDQPIKFSHKTHAGIHKIDCQYCHDGARRSKHSVIPATNTCMNCHSAIKEGSTYGRSELTKIYASAGWDPTKGAGAYIENYDEMSQKDIKRMFKKWLRGAYEEEIAAGTSSVEEVTRTVEKELEAVMEHAQKPIEWVRIHNLPDHAYFNHAQHVTVGKVECQTCHGAVEEMEVVQQYSPLSMGWCINCHRETEVQFADNEYYKAYQSYHDDLKAGKINKVTVEDIGGLECQKCHY